MKNNTNTKRTWKKGSEIKVGDALMTFFGGTTQTATVTSIKEITKSKRELSLSDGALWVIWTSQTYTVAK